MPTATITPNMSMTNPTPNQEPGPAYANDITNALNTIDAHNHTGAPNNGVQITPTAININGDLVFNSHNLTTVRSVRFASGGLLTSGGDFGCIYDNGGNLVWNNDVGVAVPITSGTSLLNGTAFNTSSFNSGTYVVDSGTLKDYFIFADATSGVLGVTMPAPSAGRVVIVKDQKGNSATHNITITRHASESIDGANTKVISTNFTAVNLVSDGTNWFTF